MQEFIEKRFLEFAGFRKTTEEELSNLKKLGLKSTLGNPISLESFFSKSLITDNHTFAFVSARFDDDELEDAEKAHLSEEFNITDSFDTVPAEYLLLAGDSVIRVFAQVRGFQEGKYVKIFRIEIPESLLPEQDTIKEIIRRAFSRLYATSDESVEKYGIRLEYYDSEAEIRFI